MYRISLVSTIARSVLSSEKNIVQQAELCKSTGVQQNEAHKRRKYFSWRKQRCTEGGKMVDSTEPLFTHIQQIQISSNRPSLSMKTLTSVSPCDAITQSRDSLIYHFSRRSIRPRAPRGIAIKTCNLARLVATLTTGYSVRLVVAPSGNLLFQASRNPTSRRGTREEVATGHAGSMYYICVCVCARAARCMLPQENDTSELIYIHGAAASAQTRRFTGERLERNREAAG